MKAFYRVTLGACAAVVSVLSVPSWGAAPSGYYNSCEGKSGKNLLTALYQTISDHTTVSYKNLFQVYKTSDVYPDGTIWDMYSTKHWSVGSTCGNYSNVGDCYNREHSFPKSWFNDASPMYSDAYHIYPTDGKVNGQRSNYPYGECEGGTTLSAPGNIKALGRLGRSTFAGYSGTVFEPDDEYKGDFARSYFYMAACYNDRISNWSSDMLAGNSYPCFSSWAVELLLKWHRQDPVSDKERDRNEAVYAYQDNRNPFIDYPDLVEHIWGTKTSQGWSRTATVTAVFNSPVAGSTVSLGNTAVGSSLSGSVTVKGTGLTADATVSVSGAGFSAGVTTLSASALNSSQGASLPITFVPTTAGMSTATVTITSAGVKLTFNVTATAYDSLTALGPVSVTDHSFDARWVNIDPAGTKYQLYVAFNGTTLAGYPVSVNAADQTYLVDNLDPETTYTFRVVSPTLTSNTVTVTTAAAIPTVNFLFDGDLEFYTTPGTVSEVAEILAQIENIPGDVTVTVKSPFEVSTDRAVWGQTVVLSPGADRLYMRVNSPAAGEYESSIVATAAGGFYNDDAVARAIVAEQVSFVEYFSNEAKSYGTTSYEGTACEWTFSNAGVWAEDADSSLPDGTGMNVRFGKNQTSSIEMAEDKSRGIGNISFYARPWTGDGDAELQVEISDDGGTTWRQVRGVTVTGDSWVKTEIPVNRAGEWRLRLRQSSGKRLHVALVEMSDYTFSGLNSTLSYHDWDAYSPAAGCLAVDVNAAAGIDVAVYDMVGITRVSAHLTGASTFELPAGLYIVVADDFARRVLVK